MTKKRGLLIAIALVAMLVLAVGLAECPAQPSDGAQASEPVAAAPTQAPRPTRPPTATAAPVPTATPEPEPTSAPTPATKPGSASAGPAAGKLVVRGADGMLYVVRANGAGLHKLTDGIDPSWSPDGDQIAFVRWREPWGLYVINSDHAAPGRSGSGEHRLIAEKHLRAPAWSPAGALVVLRGDLKDIPPQVIVIPGWGTFVVSPGGEVWQHVLKAVNPNSGAYEGDYPADAFILSPSWAPAPPEGGTGGVHLAYDGERGIYVTALGEAPRLLTPELIEATDNSPAWSPTGDRIAYVRKMHDHWEIWSMNPDGGDKQRLTPAGTEVGEKAYNSVAPAWSPDGRYIAFLTDRAGGWRVYVMRADGSGQRQLLDLPVTYEFNSDRILDWTW